MQQATAKTDQGGTVCAYVHTYVHTFLYYFRLISSGRLLQNRNPCTHVCIQRGSL